VPIAIARKALLKQHRAQSLEIVPGENQIRLGLYSAGGAISGI
jgi:hypothetical protein